MLTLAKQLAEIPAARYIALDELRQVETGLTQHHRWSLALANGEAAKCGGCGYAFLLDDLAGGICEGCAEIEENFQEIASVAQWESIPANIGLKGGSKFACAAGGT